MTIQETAKSKIIVLDGAMGTRLERCGLSEEDFRGRDFAGWDRQLKGDNDLLCLTRPDIVAGIHRR